MRDSNVAASTSHSTQKREAEEPTSQSSLLLVVNCPASNCGTCRDCFGVSVWGNFVGGTDLAAAAAARSRLIPLTLDINPTFFAVIDIEKKAEWTPSTT